MKMKNKKPDISSLYEEALNLLKKIIETPSISREEKQTADLLEAFLKEKNISVHRLKNNIWAYNKQFDSKKPTILLNSHHDTVKPNPAYSRDPYFPEEKEGKLFGLGSNDAGGCLVSLLASFLHFYDAEMQYNLCFLASAEEEVSGREGIEKAYKEIEKCAFAIVGEPTLLDLAIAEKGLMVLDCRVKGESGHAAREEGINAIYEALKDIQWFRTYEFPKVSDVLGKVKMSVTQIEAGTQHNVVPSLCTFVVDVRTTELYSNEEVLEIVRKHVEAEVTPRSTRLSSSKIEIDHPIVLSGNRLGKEIYGSPTLSDQALLPIPSLKVGPGDSARSHMADEYIFTSEIYEGIDFYIRLMSPLLFGK